MSKTAEERLNELEAVLEQMLRPVRDIPLRVVMKSLAGCDIIPIDPDSD